jgi:hypothetical protein
MLMTKHRADFDLNRPGALIAALPAVLGFVPEKSLVLVSLQGSELGSVMRADLSGELTDRVEQLAELAAAADPEAAIAVIVDADGAHCPVCNEEYRTAPGWPRRWGKRRPRARSRTARIRWAAAAATWKTR